MSMVGAAEEGSGDGDIAGDAVAVAEGRVEGDAVIGRGEGDAVGSGGGESVAAAATEKTHEALSAARREVLRIAVARSL